MTRKHFEAIAAVLNANHADISIVGDFADMCEEFNENFDRSRFVKASTLWFDDYLASQARLLNRMREEG